MYFVHSYHAKPERESDLLAVTDYYQPVTAIVGRDNVYGMQFHPEKSGDIGMQLLRIFWHCGMLGIAVLKALFPELEAS